jgi:hypothetical protein
MATALKAQQAQQGQLRREHLAGLFSFFCPKILWVTKKSRTFAALFRRTARKQVHTFSKQLFFYERTTDIQAEGMTDAPSVHFSLGNKPPTLHREKHAAKGML